MAKFAMLNATIWGGGYDFTGDTNSVQASMEADNVDVTTFGSGGWQDNIAGLKNYKLNASGLWQSGVTGTAVDPVAFANLGTSLMFMVSAMNTATQPMYAFNSLQTTYELGDDVGKAAPFSIDAEAATPYPLVRGQIAAARQTVAATGQLGSILTLTATSSTQSVYAGFHVFTAPTTITVQVQSAAAIGFASPTTRATLGPITVTGGTWMTPIAGPITDQFWRLNVSVLTGTGSVGGWIGVQ